MKYNYSHVQAQVSRPLGEPITSGLLDIERGEQGALITGAHTTCQAADTQLPNYDWAAIHFPDLYLWRITYRVELDGEGNLE